MNRNIVFSLCFNLVSEVAESMRLLYEQNDKRDFEMFVIDLGFPIEGRGDEIPKDIQFVKNNNTVALKKLAEQYGAHYLRMMNVGVSQNHTSFYKYIKPDDSDVILTSDCDEIANEGGWIRACAETLRGDGNLGYVAPLLVDAIPILENNPHAVLQEVAGHKVYYMNGNINYSQIAYSGRFLNKMGGVPYLQSAPIYGYLESALHQHLEKHKMKWGVLKDYTTVHTNNPPLYRSWKDACIFSEEFKGNQISFEEWLILKKWNKI